MVCLAVFVAQMSSDLVGKVFGIYFVLSAFGESFDFESFEERYSRSDELTWGTPRIVVSQFEHVIADMFVIPLGMMLNKSPSVAVYIWK
jgi:formate/nitrite transporter FocA (FNT family)